MTTLAHAAMLLSYGSNAFNFTRRKVGGIWFVKLGRFNVSFSVSRGPSPERIALALRAGNLAR
jgi:hypothetical protein